MTFHFRIPSLSSIFLSQRCRFDFVLTNHPSVGLGRALDLFLTSRSIFCTLGLGFGSLRTSLSYLLAEVLARFEQVSRTSWPRFWPGSNKFLARFEQVIFVAMLAQAGFYFVSRTSWNLSLATCAAMVTHQIVTHQCCRKVLVANGRPHPLLHSKRRMSECVGSKSCMGWAPLLQSLWTGAERGDPWSPTSTPAPP